MLSDNADMCYAHLSRVIRRLNMLPLSRFQNFICVGSDDGSWKMEHNSVRAVSFQIFHNCPFDK